MAHDWMSRSQNTKHLMNIKTSLLALFATASISAYADGIPLKDCPPAVQQTIQANSRSGTLDDVEKIVIQGRTRYVAEFDLARDKSLKIYVDGEGKLLKTKEDIDASELPAAVSAAVQKLVPAGGKLSDVEKQVAAGQTTYLIEIDRTNAPDLDLVVAENGTVLSQKQDHD
jgi:hypothetical protein